MAQPNYKLVIGALILMAGVLIHFQSCSQYDSQNGELASKEPAIQAAALSANAPNVIFIMIDDGGYSDFTNPEVSSPAFNKLEKRALKFTHFYTNPTCSPTRISLMTGRNPAHYGVEHAVCLPDSDVPGGTARGISRAFDSLPEVLKKMGYRTNHVGKWHIGEREGKRPIDQGFDDTIVYKYNNHTFWNPEILEYSGMNFVPARSGVVTGHKTNILTDRALGLLKKHASQFPSKKLFMNIWYNAPHHPYQPEDKWRNLYKGKGYGVEQEKYFGMLSQVDHNIGRVIQMVENDPVLSKNTLIFVTSDNGGAAKETKINYSNFPLRGSKGSLLEGGVRLPLYAYWVGKSPRAIANDSPLRTSDLMSTLVELAGGTYTGITEGESFASLLLQPSTIKKAHIRPIFWHQRGQLSYCGKKEDFLASGDWKIEPFRQAVLHGDWKFISEYEDGEAHEYLYKFADSEDESSSANVISSFPDQANQMRNLLNKLAVNKSGFFQKATTFEGSASGTDRSFSFKSPGGRVELKTHDLYENHDGSFTYALKIRPSATAIGRTSVLAQRAGSWVLRLMSNGKLHLIIKDEASGNDALLVSTTSLQADRDYNIAFTISGYVGNSKVDSLPGCEKSTFINNVARLYVYPSHIAEVPDPEDDNAADIYNVAFSGYENPVRIGNSFHNNQPFFGGIELLGAHSLALTKAQLKIVFSGQSQPED